MPEFIFRTEFIDTGNGQSNSVDLKDYSVATVVLRVSAASGTNQTLDVWLQHSSDNSTWTDMAEENLQGLFQRTSSAGQQSVTIDEFARYVRAKWVISGTNPSFTFEIKARAN
jgi:hypothetical protein